MSDFRSKHPFANRREEANRIMERYPGRIPVIVEKASRSTDIPFMDKQKFLVPNHMTVGQFLFIVRKRLTMPPEKALFVFVNGQLPTTAQTIGSIYQDHKNEDGFLYMHYSGESTFG
jgi:GABA(A) receptor-associated protein